MSLRTFCSFNFPGLLFPVLRTVTHLYVAILRGLRVVVVLRCKVATHAHNKAPNQQHVRTFPHFCLVSRQHQHHAEKLRMSDSPLQHMQRVFQGTEGVNEAELRRQLGKFSRWLASGVHLGYVIIFVAFLVGLCLPSLWDAAKFAVGRANHFCPVRSGAPYCTRLETVFNVCYRAESIALVPRFGPTCWTAAVLFSASRTTTTTTSCVVRRVCLIFPSQVPQTWCYGISSGMRLFSVHCVCASLLIFISFRLLRHLRVLGASGDAESVWRSEEPCCARGADDSPPSRSSHGRGKFNCRCERQHIALKCILADVEYSVSLVFMLLCFCRYGSRRGCVEKSTLKGAHPAPTLLSTDACGPAISRCPIKCTRRSIPLPPLWNRSAHASDQPYTFPVPFPNDVGLLPTPADQSLGPAIDRSLEERAARLRRWHSACIA